MITEQTKDALGEKLFDTICIAIREAGGVMRYTEWKLVDGKTKDNYMAIVEQMCDIVKKDFNGEPSVITTEPAAPVLLLEEVEETVTPPDGSLLASVMAEDKDNPVTLAPKLPERKKRRAKRKVKVTA